MMFPSCFRMLPLPSPEYLIEKGRSPVETAFFCHMSGVTEQRNIPYPCLRTGKQFLPMSRFSGFLFLFLQNKRKQLTYGAHGMDLDTATQIRRYLLKILAVL